MVEGLPAADLQPTRRSWLAPAQPGVVSEARSATGIALFAVGGVVALIVLIAILLVVLLV